MILRTRGELAFASGDAEMALALADQLAASTPWMHGKVLPSLWLLRGEALAALDHLPEAEACLRAAQSEAEQQGAFPLLWRIALALGRVHRAQGDGEKADAQFATARAILDRLVTELPVEPDPDAGGVSPREHVRAALSAQIPPPRSLTNLQAAKAAAGGLTAREREVAVRIAQGLTNRAIADHLSIGERTVTTHITSILAKLGFASRTQIAAWATERGLTEPQEADS
jgi:DNA-binding CsgD family transcriptional regulator